MPMQFNSQLEHDFAWLILMFAPTEIRMARVDLYALEALADNIEEK